MFAAYNQLPLPATHFRSPSTAMTPMGRLLFVSVFCITFFVTIFHITTAQNGLHKLTTETLGTYSQSVFHAASALRPATWTTLIRLGSKRSRIGTCTIAHGKHKEGYQRALNTHISHGQYHQYPTYSLDHPILDGLWSKESALLEVLLQELMKPKSEQLEWLVWFDADTVIMNKLIPIEAFLPPEERKDVHLLYTKDWNGLNNGVFILRVSNWSLELLSSILAYRSFRPKEKLPFTEQSAMEKVMQMEHYKSGVVQCPPQWFNAYPSDGGKEDVRYDHQPGQMLVHFAGIGNKSKAIDEWVDKLEANRTKWEIPLSKTNYEGQIEAFWRGLEEERLQNLEEKKAEEKKSEKEKKKVSHKQEKADEAKAKEIIEKTKSFEERTGSEKHVHTDMDKPFNFLQGTTKQQDANKETTDPRRELWDGLIL